MKATLLDWICLAAETPVRPQDFSVVLTLRGPVERAALEEGARSARNRYPKSGAVFPGGEWLPAPGDGGQIERRTPLDEFVNGPFDLGRRPPVGQLLRGGEGSQVVLATRVHHGAADGASAALWLSHQLRVSLGLRKPLVQPATPRDPALRSLRHFRRRSPFAFPKPCVPLGDGRAPGRRRAWKTILLPPLPRIEWGGFSPSDSLAVSLLEALKSWRIESGLGDGGLGLWYPVDIRRRRRRGFGNGTSRIRLYSSFPRGADRFARIRHLRRQIRWCMRNGEWAVPARDWLSRIPKRAFLSLLRWCMGRRGLDYGSAVFTLLPWPAQSPEPDSLIRKIEVVGPLHQRHALAVNGVVLGGRTWLTFTFDPELLAAPDVDFMIQALLEELAGFRRDVFEIGKAGRVARAGLPGRLPMPLEVGERAKCILPDPAPKVADSPGREGWP